MIITWLAQGQPKYTSMSPTQHIAYISDVGADVLKPLFVTGCVITGVCFFLSLCVMRLNQALVRRLERTLDVLSVLAGLLGAVCLILLSILDTRRHPHLHRMFLLLFMLGVVFSALFTTIEYRRLGKTFTQHPVLRWSYRFKIGIVVLEVLLSFAFGATMYGDKNSVAAVLEWCMFSLPLHIFTCHVESQEADRKDDVVIAFVFTFYVLSFFFDLRPKARTKEDLKKETEGQQIREADGGRETMAAALGREHYDAGRQF